MDFTPWGLGVSLYRANPVGPWSVLVQRRIGGQQTTADTSGRPASQLHAQLTDERLEEPFGRSDDISETGSEHSRNSVFDLLTDEFLEEPFGSSGDISETGCAEFA
jgi:hypothetical protein